MPWSDLNHRKAGEVVKVRVNPKDCLAVLDTMVAIGLNPSDHSFAGCVSITLSSLIAMARKAGALPQEEDGEKYWERMAPFRAGRSTQVKRERTNAFYNRGVQGYGPLTPPIPNSPPIQSPQEKEALQKEYDTLLGQYNKGDESVLPRMIELQGKLF